MFEAITQGDLRFKWHKDHINGVKFQKEFPNRSERVIVLMEIAIKIVF